MVARGSHARTIAFMLLLSPAARAADLGGRWEVQSMGADREITLQQKGTKLVAHRVMWPTFEGQKYKLEHLYRGEIKGNKISGDLLVKEDELPQFEVLRSFTGSIDAPNRLVLDGLPLRRLDAAPAAPENPPPPTTPASPNRPSEPPTLAQTTPPPPAAPSAPPPPSPAEPEDPGATLFASIMGSPGSENLFKVSMSVTLSDGAAELVARGDELAAAGKYNAALAKYEQAAALPGGNRAQLLHRIGRCRLKLGEYPQARDTLRQALRLDPANSKIKQDYRVASARVRK